MKNIEIEILSIIKKGNNPEVTAKAIYKRMLKYFKKCCNDNCRYNLEGICKYYRHGHTLSCSNQQTKRSKK
jgi:hypothetical protein